MTLDLAFENGIVSRRNACAFRPMLKDCMCFCLIPCKSINLLNFPKIQVGKGLKMNGSPQ